MALVFAILGAVFHFVNIVIGKSGRKRVQEAMDDLWKYLEDKRSYEELIRANVARLVQRVSAFPRKTLLLVLVVFGVYAMNAVAITLYQTGVIGRGIPISIGPFLSTFGANAWGFKSVVTGLATAYAVLSLFVTIKLLLLIVRSTGCRSLAFMLSVDAVVAAIGFIWVTAAAALYQATVYVWLVNRGLRELGLPGAFEYHGLALFWASLVDFWTGKGFRSDPATGGIGIVFYIIPVGISSAIPTLAHLGLALITVILKATPGPLRSGLNRFVYLFGKSEANDLLSKLGGGCLAMALIFTLLWQLLRVQGC